MRPNVQHGDASAKPLEKGAQANCVGALRKYIRSHKPIPGEEVRKLVLQLLRTGLYGLFKSAKLSLHGIWMFLSVFSKQLGGLLGVLRLHRPISGRKQLHGKSRLLLSRPVEALLQLCLLLFQGGHLRLQISNNNF